MGEQHREDRADRVAGVRQPQPQRERLRAHVQIALDVRGQRRQRRGEREVGHQREDRHGGDEWVATRKGP